MIKTEPHRDPELMMLRVLSVTSFVLAMVTIVSIFSIW